MVLAWRGKYGGHLPFTIYHLSFFFLIELGMWEIFLTRRESELGFLGLNDFRIFLSEL
jgi:hypothetical protein